MTLPRHHAISCAGDVTLDIAAYGPADATPLVLLHGFSDSRLSFEPLAQALPDGLLRVAVTQRGHGASSKPRHGYRAADFTSDLAQVLDGLGQDRALLVGHSMGAWVAMHFAQAHPDRVAGLVLIGAFAGFAENAGVTALKAEIDALGDPVDPAFVRGFQEAASSPALSPAFMDMVVAESMRLPRHVWQAIVDAFLRDDMPRDLSSFQAPSLLIWGEQDAFVARADQEALLRRLPKARLATFATAGHSPHWEDPEAVAALIEGFARTTLA